MKRVNKNLRHLDLMYPGLDTDCLRRQPGYTSRAIVGVQRTLSGGWRLYALVDRRWMDASLADLPEHVAAALDGRVTS